MATAALRAGTAIAGYTLEGVLGRGGMSVVYRATHPDREQPVALKLMNVDASWSVEARERLQHEARLAGAVFHRHILPVYEAGQHDGHLFVAMRLEETDLAALLREQGRLSPSRAVSLVSQVASALDAAHAHGLVHRDIKPSNVLLGEDEGEECAYVADFGVARAAFADGELLSGDMVGTVGYAAPEQIRGEAVDHRSDVYALGCLLYECLTGRVPFDRRDSLATLWAHLHEEPPAPSLLAPGLDVRLDDVVARALAKGREARFGSAGALARAAAEAVNGRRKPAPERREPAELPSGTVTFLFTDVEGSTRLLHELGAEEYAHALGEHRELVRDACSVNGGVEVDTQGDAFFFAFTSAIGAVAAARELTAALAPGLVRVRVGIHTGTPHVTSEGYVGQDVHRAARIAAAGHGGQILVSAPTAALVEPSGSEPQALSLRSLGAHRLKDFEEPVTLHQLGEGDFPPLKTVANTNLPTPVSSFLGRETELYEADLRLQETRLLTISGPGGAGKTRFAIELARRAREERFSDYEDGVFSCFLAPLRDPELVLSTIAQTLSVVEQPGRSALETLSSQLAGKRMLVLLDNLEHLLTCAAELTALLDACPRLTLLVTSRERLRLDGEVPFELPALSEDEGVALFCERARAEPSAPIRELCARLDGLPLAIELAAARMSLLSPEQLLERLSQRLDLLKAGRDKEPRQQTLRATIQWSYDLLAPEEKALFARLSVFAGGCTLEAAEEVCDADLDALESLLDKSLLRRRDGRFWMLETIREFAAQRLEESGADVVQARLRRHTVALVEAVGGELQSSQEAVISARLAPEFPNVRQVVALALATREPDDVGRILQALFPFLITHHLREARAWVHAALALRDGFSDDGLLATLIGGSEIVRFAGEQALATELKSEFVELAPSGSRWTAAMLADLCDIATDRGDFDEARRYAERSLAAGGRERAELSLAELALRTGDLRGAVSYGGKALSGLEAGEWNHACALEMLGETARRSGNRAEARGYFTDALRSFRELGDPGGVAICLDGAARLAVDEGDIDRAGRLVAAARQLRETSGHQPIRGDVLLPAVPASVRPQEPAMTLDEAVAYALEGLDDV